MGDEGKSDALSAGDSGFAMVQPRVDPRTRILLAARREFFSHGFARTTMDDLAAQLAMSKKTLYRHFRGKDEIVLALIETKGAEIRAGFDEILARRDASFIDRVGAIFQHIHHQLGEISAPFFRDLKRLQPAGYARLEAVRSELLPRVWGQVLREGVGSGALRPDIDPDEAAYMLLVIIQSLMQPEHLARLRIAPHALAERVFDLVFTGMLTPEGQKAYENNRPGF